MPNSTAITVTPSTTFRRLMAPSMIGPISIRLSRAPPALARLRDLHLLTLGHVRLADGDDPHGAREAAHPDAVRRLLHHAHRGEGHPIVVGHIAHALPSGGVEHQGGDRDQ